MRCRRCSGPAVIEVRRHNSAFCRDCFVVVVREQVRKAIKRFDMFTRGFASDRGADLIEVDLADAYGFDIPTALFRRADTAVLRPCERCDQPTTGRFCAFCRARAQVLGERLDIVPERDDEVAAELADEVLPAEIYGGIG